jgi:hypothetical protein
MARREATCRFSDGWMGASSEEAEEEIARQQPVVGQGRARVSRRDIQDISLAEAFDWHEGLFGTHRQVPASTA